MVAVNGSDYRHSSEPELLGGLRAGHALALAEAYHRTVPGVHAAARRLLGSPRDVEGLLAKLYAELWRQPPQEPPLEGWLRARSFSLGSAELHARGAAPASASLGPLLGDLPAPPAARDALERELAELDETERRVLVAAFDLGRASLHQDQPGAPAALDRALRALAGPDPADEDAEHRSSPCQEIEGLADWTLGLLGREEGEAVGTAVAERADCHARARTLRRGRRRLEGLPPPPDVGQRVIARVLAGDVATGAPSPHRTAAAASPGADTAGTATGTDPAPRPENAAAVPPPTARVTEPGASPAEPGAPPAQPQASPAEPGAPPAQPGAPPAEPGAPPAQPQASPAEPGAPPAQPQASPGEPGSPPAGSATAPTTRPAGQDHAPAAEPGGAPAGEPPGTSDEALQQLLRGAAPPESRPTETEASVTGAGEVSPSEASPAEAAVDEAAEDEAAEDEEGEDEEVALARGPRGRQVLRRVVGAVVVLLVLAVGAAAGLGIGLLIVGGL